MIELRWLRSFLAVADEMHLSRAARKLHLAQPALTNQIQQLERFLGANLFQRTVLRNCSCAPWEFQDIGKLSELLPRSRRDHRTQPGVSTPGTAQVARRPEAEGGARGVGLRTSEKSVTGIRFSADTHIDEQTSSRFDERNWRGIKRVLWRPFSTSNPADRVFFLERTACEGASPGVAGSWG
jgi:hypothetical protein